MTLKGNPCTASFVMTAGSASAVTLVAGNAPAALPNGTYLMTVSQDETGTSITLSTPLGAIGSTGVQHLGTD
jgi:hypothetical protein